jgi:hypothetical protein
VNAYVAIRPGNEQPIHVVCVPCSLDEPADRWHTALHGARTHNHEQHP